MKLNANFGEMSLYLQLWSQDALLLIIMGTGSDCVAVNRIKKHAKYKELFFPPCEYPGRTTMQYNYPKLDIMDWLEVVTLT